ncbi:hypothetical protein [Acinetobacter bereziniae]
MKKPKLNQYNHWSTWSLFPKIESHGASLAIHQAALIIKSLL